MSLPISAPPGIAGGDGSNASEISPDMLLYIAQEAVIATTVSRYAVIGSIVVAVYDWLINLDREVEFIHRSHWTMVKSAYLFSRYYVLIFICPFVVWALVLDHTEDVCNSKFRAVYILVIPSITSAQLILMLRTYAFTNSQRWVLVVLSSGLLLVTAIMVLFFARNIELVNLLFDLFGRAGCFASSDQYNPVGSIHLGIVFASLFLFDAVNIGIVIRHRLLEGCSLGDLGRALFEQAIVYYCVMTVLNLLTTSLYFLQDRRYNGIGSWWAFILPSVLSCRLILTLRRKAAPTTTEFLSRVNHEVDEVLEMVCLARENESDLESPRRYCHMGDRPIHAA